MSSLTAQFVAQEVSEKVRKGLKINMGKILRNHGYSLQTSRKPKKVTGTKTFRDVIKPVVDQMIEERVLALKEMKKRRHKATYRDLSMAVRNLSHDIQLISGRSTENLAVMHLPEEIIKKHGIDTID